MNNIKEKFIKYCDKTLKYLTIFFKAIIFIIILIWPVFFLIGYEGFLDAGIILWAIYAIFIIVCIAALVQIPKASCEKVFKLLILVNFLGLLTECSHCTHKIEYKLISLGKTINHICNIEGKCPTKLEDWSRTEKGHSHNFRKGRFHFYYNSSYKTDDSTAFMLRYHFGPDWDYFVYGGKDKELIFDTQIGDEL